MKKIIILRQCGMSPQGPQREQCDIVGIQKKPNNER